MDDEPMYDRNENDVLSQLHLIKDCINSTDAGSNFKTSFLLKKLEELRECTIRKR